MEQPVESTDNGELTREEVIDILKEFEVKNPMWSRGCLAIWLNNFDNAMGVSIY